MTRFWIRVNARLADDKEVRAFARVLFPTMPAWIAVSAACGLLVTLWGRVVDEQEDGCLAHVDDDAIEEWAKWRGVAGDFAVAVRDAFTDDAGHIKEWEEYQGALIDRRRKDRDRKAARKRAAVPQENGAVPQEPPAERVGTSDGVPAVRENVNGNGNEQTHSFTGREILLAGLPDRSRAAWTAEMNGRRQGMHGPVMTDEQIDTAARQYVGDGHLASPSLRHFSGYLLSASRRAEPPASDGASRRPKRRTPTDSAASPYAAALSGDDE